MSSSGTPEAEVEIDEALVRSLLAAQMPELSAHSIELLDAGWDNMSFRVGRDYIVRIPRRETAVPLLAHEQKWLPRLATHLPFAVPVPLAVGHPGAGYPWSWSLLPFIAGSTADLDLPNKDQAEPFAGFLRALHQPPPSDAPTNAVRGVPLAHRVENIEGRLVRLRARTDSISTVIERIWESALAAEVADHSVWLHGDLHARNVLVDQGRFTGIIDWGDMTAGDAATDLAATWMLFADPEARERTLRAYDLSAESDALLIRAMGWAVLFGAVLLDSGLVDHPRHAAMGAATLARLHEDDLPQHTL